MTQPQSGKRHWGRRIRRWLAGSAAVVVILLAILVGAFRLLVPQVGDYRESIAQWAGDAIGAPVTIGEMDVRWRWLIPEIVFSDVVVRPDAAEVEPLIAEEIAVELSLLDLVRPGPVRPGQVVIRGGRFEVRRDVRGRIQVPGLAVFDPADDSADGNWRELLAEIMARADYRILDSRLRLSDAVTGTGPIEAGIERVWLHSEDRSYRLVLQLALPTAMEGRIGVDVTATGPSRRPEDWAWQGTTHVTVGNLAALFGALAPSDWPSFTGAVESRLDLTGTGTRVNSLRGEAQARRLGRTDSGPTMSSPDARRRFDIRLGGIEGRREAGGWRLSIAELAPAVQENWPASRLDLRWRADEGRTRLTAALRYARIGDLLRMARELGREAVPGRGWLERLQPEGEIRDVVAELQLRGGRLHDYSVQGRVTRAGMESWEAIPGFSGLSGWLQADGDGGSFEIDAGPVDFDYPRIFRSVLRAEHLQTTVHWERHESGWRIRAPEIRARNADATARAEFRLDLPTGGEPQLYLDATVPEARATNLGDYLPVGKMPDKAVTWLDEADIEGTARNGRVRVEGPVEPFPYRNGEGVFEVDARISEGALTFDEDWPRLTGIRAQLRFRGPAMTVEASAGRISGYRLDSARAHVPDLDADDPVLSVEASGGGRVADGLALLRASPVGERFHEELAPLTLDGDSRTAISMRIPLDRPDDLRLDGESAVSGVSGRIDWFPAPLERISGSLVFTEDGVASDGIEGRVFGGPFRLTVDAGSRGRDAPESAPPETVASLEGQLDMARVAATRPGSLALSRARGRLAWQGEVRIPNHDELAPVRVRINSDLEGVALDLPHPVGKTADETRPLEIRFPVTDPTVRAQVDYGEAVDLTFAIDRRRPAAERITGLRIDINQPRPEEAVQPGVRIAGHLDRLDLLPWLNLEQGGEHSPAPDPEWLELHVGELRVGRLSFRDQNVGVTAREDDWLFSLTGPDAEGEFRIPRGESVTGPTIGRMRHLNIRPVESQDGDGFELLPHKWEPLDLTIGQVLHDDMSLGELNVQLRRWPDGIALTRLTLDGEGLSAELRGDWHLDPVTGTRGRLNGTLRVGDIQRALALFGFQPGVEGEQGRMEMDLDWAGASPDRLLSGLNGRVSLRLDSGHLREVRPGAGRVFGLLSITALPRRLFGDFRDVFGAGLRYDRIAGDFFLVDGDAFTANLRLDGPVVNVSASGRIGLVTRDYDQRVTVETPVGATLPMAGVLAGGASVGALMLVLSQVFSEPLSEIGSLEYRVDGSWEDPRLTPLNEETRRALEDE